MTAADPDPVVGTIPIVCILHRVTSKGYDNVCASRLDNRLLISLSNVDGSRPMRTRTSRFACSLIVNANPE